MVKRHLTPAGPRSRLPSPPLPARGTMSASDPAFLSATELMLHYLRDAVAGGGCKGLPGSGSGAGTIRSTPSVWSTRRARLRRPRPRRALAEGRASGWSTVSRRRSRTWCSRAAGRFAAAATPPPSIRQPWRCARHGAAARGRGRVLGSTTTPEFGWKAVTDNPLGHFARNPWNIAMTPGGSSGGAASRQLWAWARCMSAPTAAARSGSRPASAASWA